jgi:hypothetical protein
LEFLADTRAEQIQELRDEIENFRNWANGGNGVALASLVSIVGDPKATLRQKLRASATVLGYRVDDDRIGAFVRGFLESVCESADVLIDYKIEAAELLRKAAGDVLLRPSIEKLTTPAPPVDRELERRELEAESARKRRHIEEQSRLDQEELARGGWVPQRSA